MALLWAGTESLCREGMQKNLDGTGLGGGRQGNWMQDWEASGSKEKGIDSHGEFLRERERIAW